MGDSSQDLRRQLPSVDRLIAGKQGRRLCELYGTRLVTVQARSVLDRFRAELSGLSGESAQRFLNGSGFSGGLVVRLEEALQVATGGGPVQRVLNATGILIHTNLGRSPLPRDVAAELPALLDAYCDLEIDLEAGQRGDRNKRVDRLLRAATGADAALVVNNAAAALFLILTEFAAGKEVVVSRGELVEIGGSFRIPDILTASGCRLVEVGTTNRTHLTDYQDAITPQTGLLLKVFPSNYRISGFVAEVGPEELAKLGSESGITVAIDEGSGLLRRSERPALRDHASFEGLLAAGCDLVCGSGDKLLGGPQAGLIAGRAELVGRLRRHPLYRALRPDRTALVTLGAVLARALRGDPAPLDRMWPEPESHRQRLETVARQVGGELLAVEGYLGGGAGAEIPIESTGISLERGEWMARLLRTGAPPVVGYVRDDLLLLDLRTVDPADDAQLIVAIRAAQASLEAGEGRSEAAQREVETR